MVEWKKLGEVCKIHTGSQLNRADMLEDGPYPVVNGGKEYSGFTDRSNENANTITISQGGESAGFVNWINVNFWAGAHCYVIERNDNFNKRYLYHTLKNKQRDLQIAKQGAGIPGLNRDTLYKLIIPIPTLSEQNRIVGILDTFTASIDNLKEQITQRRKQYEYYRDQLLDLEGKEGVEMKAMGDLFTFKNGLNKGKEYFGNGKPIIMFTNVFKSRYIDNSMVNNKVDISESELERINAHKGDVFFTRTSETKEEVGYASVLIEEIEECTFAGFLIRARPVTNTILPTYCKYCFSTPKIRDSIVSKSSFTTRASLTGASLAEVKLYLPSLQEQQRIVDILDKFEASIQNLEAQLSQREKQYEYYRNKLLTFE